jgi:hypothetical protein
MNSLKREATRGVIIVKVETVEQLFGWAKWGNSFVGKYVYIYILGCQPIKIVYTFRAAQHTRLTQLVFHEGIGHVCRGAGSVSWGIGNVPWLTPLALPGYNPGSPIPEHVVK